MDTRIPARLTAGQGRRFALTVGIAFLALAALLTWRSHDTLAFIAASLGSVLVIAGLLVPRRLGPVYRGWMAFGLAVSRVTTPVFLGAVFFLVITPVGLLARLFGHRPLSAAATRPSGWNPRPSDGRRSDLNRQF